MWFAHLTRCPHGRCVDHIRFQVVPMVDYATIKKQARGYLDGYYRTGLDDESHKAHSAAVTSFSAADNAMAAVTHRWQTLWVRGGGQCIGSDTHLAVRLVSPRDPADPRLPCTATSDIDTCSRQGRVEMQVASTHTPSLYKHALKSQCNMHIYNTVLLSCQG